jgi:hypothetical protein
MATALEQGVKGSVCRFNLAFASDCATGLFCEGSWRQTGDQGQCRCDRLFGFYGAQCTELSVITYLFAAMIALVAIHASYVLHISAQHAIAFYGGNPCRMISSSGGRAIMFSVLLSMAVGFTALVTGLYALQIIRDTYFVRLSALICKGCYGFCFIGATLSVSAVWFQMAEKIRAGTGKSTKFWMMPGVSVGVIAFLCMAVIVLVSGYEQSSSVAGMVAAIICIGFISYTYRVAGRRVVAVLSLGNSDGRSGNRGALSNAAQQTQIIAIKVRETASFMSRAFAVLGVVFLWLALSIPSQKPIYPGQNDLPRLYSGQVAVAAVRLRLLHAYLVLRNVRLIIRVLSSCFSSFFFPLHAAF